MTFAPASVLGILGPLGMCTMFVVLGLLSRRLGRVNRTPPFYVGFFVAALLVAISAVLRVADPGLSGSGTAPVDPLTQPALVATAITAVGATLAALVAWRYWSWLLAERG